jgi:hypothetical protein
MSTYLFSGLLFVAVFISITIYECFAEDFIDWGAEEVIL